MITDMSVTLEYTKDGKTEERRVVPKKIRWDVHPDREEPTWLMDTFDLDRQGYRTFILSQVRVKP